MNKLKEALKADFGVDLSVEFTKCACYYSSIDCVEYLADDFLAIADRIDPFLTVLWNEDFSDYVGFKLKGFRAWYVDSNYKGSDFNLLVKALEDFVTKMGDEMFSEDEAGKRKTVYKNVIDFVNRENIGIAANDMEEIKAVVAA
ncbi:MAG: hypothetical protein RQ899_01900 [Pseudomonadales bacterium]|nr:hypothetical protein [Pseudomonadales bacterium]